MLAIRTRTRTGSRRGQTLVEFALVLPIFILLLVGIFDFGRAIYAYNTISNAAREGVRVGIVDQNCNVIGAEAANHAASLDVNFAPTVAAPCGPAGTGVVIQFLNSDGSTPSGGDNCVEPDLDPGVPIGCLVEVTVSYEYNAATPIIGNLVGTLDLQASTRQAVEFTNETP
jgi:Flp pilus assembly protein TadG